MTLTTPARLRRLLATLLLVSLPLTAAACGDDDEPSDSDASGSGSGSGSEPDDSAEEPDYTITGLSYDDFTVEAGADVYVQNDGGAPHTFTSDDDAFEEAEIDPGDLGETVAPMEPGTYDFHCEIHPDAMFATLTVE